MIASITITANSSINVKPFFIISYSFSILRIYRITHKKKKKKKQGIFSKNIPVLQIILS